MIPQEVRELLPPGAYLVKKTTTRLGLTFIFEHKVGNYIMDGDRITIKLRHAHNPRAIIAEKIWDENPLTPPPAPVKKPERRAVAVLINPENPFYIWEGQKPAPRTPCFIVQKKADLTIIDAQTNEVIGRGVPAP